MCACVSLHTGLSSATTTDKDAFAKLRDETHRLLAAGETSLTLCLHASKPAQMRDVLPTCAWVGQKACA